MKRWEIELKKGNIFEVYGPLGMGIDYGKLIVYIKNLLDKRKSEIRKKIENMNSTIHIPVGGISNIEWLRKEDILKKLK